MGSHSGLQGIRPAAAVDLGILPAAELSQPGSQMHTSNRLACHPCSNRISATSRTAVYGPVRTVVWRGGAARLPPIPIRGHGGYNQRLHCRAAIGGQAVSRFRCRLRDLARDHGRRRIVGARRWRTKASTRRPLRKPAYRPFVGPGPAERALHLARRKELCVAPPGIAWRGERRGRRHARFLAFASGLLPRMSANCSSPSSTSDRTDDWHGVPHFCHELFTMALFLSTK